MFTKQEIEQLFMWIVGIATGIIATLLFTT